MVANYKIKLDVNKLNYFIFVLHINNLSKNNGTITYSGQ